jgi:hypothetical protein
MKLLILSTCDNLIDGQQRALEDSLIKHGYDYEFFLYGFIFGEQYRVIKTFVDKYKGEATHILYSDMFDTVALGPPSEVISKFKSLDCKMLIGVEKACFPNDERDKYHRIENYPESPTAWKYINGGGCIFEIEYFKELCNQHPFNNDRMMDPDWLAELHQSHPDQIKLDYQCSIFQCLAHSNPEEEWIKDIGNRIQNIATQTKPIFFHGNGRTDMQWVKTIALEQPNNKTTKDLY